MLVAGTHRWVPVLAENLVYVPLLALGCFGTGRLVAGAKAGCLAVVLALGSPLLIEQFHVFMLDAPLAALVAAAAWLLLESRRFERVGVSTIAGVVVGIGLESKEQLPQYLVGLVAVMLARGGWRNWRGWLSFAAVAFAIGSPWYFANLGQFGDLAASGYATAHLVPRGHPPLLSLSNAGWYGWATLNALLFAPLFAFAVTGVVRATVQQWRILRARASRSDLGEHAPELLGGLFASWLTLTTMTHHDMRYTMPLIVYLAVIGTAWVARLSARRQQVAVAALAAAVLATTLGASAGVGGEVHIALAGDPARTERILGIPHTDQITLYSNRDFLVSGPQRRPDVGRLFHALHGEGFTGVYWSGDAVGDPVFDGQGLAALAGLEGLATPRVQRAYSFRDPHHAFLIREPPSGTPFCVDLGDGTGLVVVAGSPWMPTPTPHCPAIEGAG